MREGRDQGAIPVNWIQTMTDAKRQSVTLFDDEVM